MSSALNGPKRFDYIFHILLDVYITHGSVIVDMHRSVEISSILIIRLQSHLQYLILNKLQIKKNYQIIALAVCTRFFFWHY